MLLALAASGCGGSKGRPLAVTTGMTTTQVRATAGKPLRVVTSNPRNPDCWAYVVKRSGHPDEQLALCFKHGRVDYIGP